VGRCGSEAEDLEEPEVESNELWLVGVLAPAGIGGNGRTYARGRGVTLSEPSLAVPKSGNLSRRTPTAVLEYALGFLEEFHLSGRPGL
jgi:hypothetical protein